MSWSARVVSAAALRAVILALVAVSLAARADISPAQLLVAGGKGCDSPAWSPDGTRIAYRQFGGPMSYPALYVANADGSKPREIAPPMPLGGTLAWSPDSSRIACSWYGSVYQILILNSDGTDTALLPRVGHGSHVLAWTPAGARLLYAALGRRRLGDRSANGDGIYSMNPDGSDPMRVCADNVGQIALAPGGRTVAYTFRQEDAEERSVRLQPIDGSEATDLTVPGLAGRDVTWSPDGGWIAYVGSHEDGGKIFAARADGSDRTQVTHGDLSYQSPAWSPDGRRIAFVSHRDGGDAIYAVDVAEAFPDVVANAPALPRGSAPVGAKSDMYVLSVGVGGSAEGATDFADACRAQTGGYYGEVVVRAITGEEATARAIRHGLLWLRTETGDGDTAVCLLSGEGLRDQAGDPYIRAYDTDTSRVASTAVPGSDVDRLIGGIAGAAIVLADLGAPTLLVGYTDEEAHIHTQYGRGDVATPFVLYAVGEVGAQQRSAGQQRSPHPQRVGCVRPRRPRAALGQAIRLRAVWPWLGGHSPVRSARRRDRPMKLAALQRRGRAATRLLPRGVGKQVRHELVREVVGMPEMVVVAVVFLHVAEVVRPADEGGDPGRAPDALDGLRATPTVTRGVGASGRSLPCASRAVRRITPKRACSPACGKTSTNTSSGSWAFW